MQSTDPWQPPTVSDIHGCPRTPCPRWGWYLWLCRQWSSRCSSSGSTRRGCRTGTCAARRSHRRSGPRRSLKSHHQHGRSNVGWAAGPAPAPQHPRSETKHRHFPVGGTPLLHGQPHQQGLQRHLSLLPPGFCWDPSSTLAVQLEGGRGFARADICVLPAHLLPILRLQPRWPVAMATTWSPPHTTRAPQPLHQPRSHTRSISCWLQAGGNRHGLQLTFSSTGSNEQGQGEGREEQPHPGRQERSPPATVWAGARLLSAPQYPTVYSACPGWRKQTGQGQSGREGAETLCHPLCPTAHAELGEFWPPRTRRWLQEPLAMPLLLVTSQLGCGSDTGSECRGRQWARARTQF